MVLTPVAAWKADTTSTPLMRSAVRDLGWKKSRSSDLPTGVILLLLFRVLRYTKGGHVLRTIVAASVVVVTWLVAKPFVVRLVDKLGNKWGDWLKKGDWWK